MKGKESLKFGMILGLVCILYFMLTNLLGVSGTEWAGWLGYGPYLIVIVIGLLLHTPPLRSYISRLHFGVSVSLIAAILSSVFMYLYLTFVDDLMVRTVVENAIVSLDPNGSNYSEQVLKIRRTITPLFYLIFGMIVGTIMGVMISLVSSIFVRTRSTNLENL